MATALLDSTIVREYLLRTPQSARLAASARETFPGGVTHDARHIQPHPIYVARAEGSRKWDVDGNEYVDYTGGHGALILGHGHPKVVAAVERQLTLGTHLGASHEGELRWGELVRRMVPSAEQVRFTNSGTEATLLALRVARAATGRPKVIRFRGHFHGWHDHVSDSPGIVAGLAEQMLILPPGDLPAAEAAIMGRDDVAAVIVEPTGSSWGQVPLLPEFLHALRKWTAQRGVLLIFDEVISGFRCAPGGAQEVWNVKPDLTTLAKILAGGLPGGALVGARRWMDALAFAQPGVEPRAKIPHYGTFNANPLSAAAGCATLELIEQEDVCGRANRFAQRLRERLNQVLVEERVPWTVYGTFSGFHIFTNPIGPPASADEIAAGTVGFDRLKAPVPGDLLTRLRLGMLVHGVELFAWPGGPTSAVHTDDDLQRTADALRGTVRMLRDDGLLDRRDAPTPARA